MASLFGFHLGRNKKQDEIEKQSVVHPTEEDGSTTIEYASVGGAFGSYVDLEGKAKHEGELITKYREMSGHPECDEAISDIINESIVIDNINEPVSIVLDDVDCVSETIKDKIREEFDNILSLLDFSNSGYDIYKKWYVDGRLFYFIDIDEKSPRSGIQKLRYIDPRRARKVTEIKKERDQRTGATLYGEPKTYYIYNQSGGYSAGSGNGQSVKIATDSVIYVHSGVVDAKNRFVVSHLHKAIKPLNQLSMMEDAVVIYRISRAPERRIFYIDVGGMPKAKAEQYLREMMQKHKNKLVYDASTGQLANERRNMSMLEDYWFPRREGGRGTEVETLPSGQNLGEMEEVDYFRRKLYRALNVPISRMEADSQFNVGRSSEITRDEVKFSKFINRLRTRFSMLFDDILEIQLSLKGIMSREEFKELKNSIKYDFNEDNHFAEMKDAEIFRERTSLLGDFDGYKGEYFSKKWIWKNVLRLTEEEIKTMQDEIAAETSDNENSAADEVPEEEPEKDGVEQQQEEEFVKQAVMFIDEMN